MASVGRRRESAIVELRVDEAPSPIGDIILVMMGEALCALDYVDCRSRMLALLEARYGRARLKPAVDPSGMASRVRGYFDGDCGALDAVPVAMGGTMFQQRVWSALRRIPPGTTASYGEIAASIGQPVAARAVGAASARNPVALVIPCHRLVGGDGSLTGYAGGVGRKRWLLAHEGVDLFR